MKLEKGICTESLRPVFNQHLARVFPHGKMCETLAEQGWDFQEATPAGFGRPVKKVYDGKIGLLEMSRKRRRAVGKEARDAGVPYKRLHWLASFTPHSITSDDAAVQARTIEFLKRLAGAAADLGDVLDFVYGSPPSRKVDGDVTNVHYERAGSVFSQAMSAFRDAGITLRIEFLAKKETPFINTPDEARRLIVGVNHPNFAGHWDVKAASAAFGDVEEVCRAMVTHKDMVGYFHANDAQGAIPGYGSQDCQPGSGETTNFVPIFEALSKIGYEGGMSVELFSMMEGFPGYPVEDPLPLMKQALRYLENCEAAIAT